MNNKNFENGQIVEKNIVSEKLYSLFLRCSHALSRGHHQENGIHPSQWRILSILAQTGEMAQRDLLEVLQIRAASLSELLSKLESRGLITREKEAGNKRNVNVELTELGKMAIDENANVQYETAQELFSMISLEEQQHLIEVLEKLINSWHEQHHGSAAKNQHKHEHHEGNHDDHTGHDDMHHGGSRSPRDQHGHHSHHYRKDF
ncbi:MarR family transcriptional regulator [Lacrimispora sp. BS-2]|uniref:MarR family transcriptional regulator n=1 Tax=Lacrimispora sp. BS-2 TaxID=3151850 RepID=A0AAU7PQ05_9FIRM